MSMKIATSPPLTEVTALLEQSGLPTADLSIELLKDFIGAFDGHSLVGVVGLERLDSTGLVRSLAVSPNSQRSGLGEKLLAQLEAQAIAQGVASLYLLTTDADGYFVRQGYTRIPRDEAPEVIRQTRQFASLCPGSATVMKKDLA